MGRKNRNIKNEKMNKTYRRDDISSSWESKLLFDLNKQKNNNKKSKRRK